MRYRFGAFEFDTSTSLLLKNAREVPLEPQPARVLAHLLAHADQIVSKEQLRRAVWGDDTHVDFDRGLAYCLSQVRAALGDSGENPRFVQTLPRRGYRFVAPVLSADVTPPTDVVPASPRRDRSWLWPALAAFSAIAILGVGWYITRGTETASPRAVVAVSIFDNETGAAEYDALVAGLSDLVVTRLTGLDSNRLGVIGNAAVLRQPRNIRNLKALAQNVKADYALLGQLQRTNAGFRFITHLIKLDDETHLRANRIAIPGTDMSGLEDAVLAEFERAVRQYVLRETS